jgi:tetratricopeptide (TPR) repeat protein/SAM-dependent methyltransferase
MSQSVDQALRKAKRHANRGETDLAAQIYRSVLNKFPNNKRATEGLNTLYQPKPRKAARQARPSQTQIDGLINLYNQGRLQETRAQGEALATQFPFVAFFPNLLGIVSADLGQSEQAVANYTKALQIEPDFTEAHYNLGNVLNGLGRSEEAVASLTRALALKPDFVEAHNNLGNIFKALGRSEEAIACLTKALEIEPNAAEVHYNLGVALNDLGKPEEALKSFVKAVAIKPDHAEAHNNLGAALNALGRPQEAIASLTRALALQPEFAEAHNNLGNALRTLGRIEEAIASLTKAVDFKPDFAAAHNNLGAALHYLGKSEEAIAHYSQAVALAPDNNETWQSFSGLLSGLSFDDYDPQGADIFLDLLARKTVVRPAAVVKPILSLLTHHPVIKEALQRLARDDDQDMPLDVCGGLSDIPLFIRIIELCPVPDLSVENLLRTMRRVLLLDGDTPVDRASILGFRTALALHCYTNEYIFGETSEETSAVQALEKEIDGLSAEGTALDPHRIACLASYRPLHGYGWAHRLPVPEGLEELFERQVHSVREEASIRAEIRALGTIEDRISNAVRDQYEENPYPRWENTALHARPSTISSFARSLELKLADDTVTPADRPAILIAGCGTGQQALATATRFLDCKVLAVDLSLASLSYAIRKTRELGITNIEYMQADILDLASLDQRFDLVESSGVLHHMADPVAGWKVLTDLLKPGGLMNIGLYSELARRHIVAAREKIAEMALSDSFYDMLLFRAAVLDPDSEASAGLEKIIESGAFFSTSELRDLLFHVQEHRFSLPQVAIILDELGLTFAGFEFSDKNVTRKFVQDHSGSQALYSLGEWHDFETAHPDTFRGMYQFWSQKNVGS